MNARRRAVGSFVWQASANAVGTVVALSVAYFYGVATGIITRNWEAVLWLLATLTAGLVAVGLIVRQRSRQEAEMDDLAEDIALWRRISELPPEDRDHVRAMLREKWPDVFGRRPDDL